MNKTIVLALYQKEMTDILRDKKTILMMIVVPLLLYPLLFFISLYVISSSMSSSTTQTFLVGVADAAAEQELIADIQEIAADYGYSFIFPELEGGEDVLSQALQSGEISAYIQEDTENPGQYSIIYNSSDSASSTACGMLVDVLKEVRSRRQVEILEEMDLDAQSVLEPISYTLEDQASSEETVGAVFGYIVPFLLVTSILMGALYPAIDCTAGEKERGTLETLLTLPVRNLELITSKFLATSTVAVAAAFLNVLSMGILCGYFFSSMQATAELVLEFDLAAYVPAILLMLLLAVVLALLASAVCLCVCIFAKSFKEAQNYTTPVMLMFLFASMSTMLPDISLEKGIELIPVVNAVLLISELFQFDFDAGHIAAVLLSDLAYAVLAVLLMARTFRSEEILFGESSSGMRLLEKRSQMKEKQIPGPGDMLLLMAALILTVLLAGSLLIVKFGIWGLVGEQLLMAALVLGYCWYIKTDFARVFRFRRISAKNLLAGVLCWAGTYVVMLLLTAVLTKFFPESAQSADSQMLSIWEGQPLWLIIVSSALLPAICEEIVFRGFLLGTLSGHYKVSAAIFWTGALFGLYHMNMIKFVVVGLLGGMFAYMVTKAGSIWISVLAHFLNNLFAVLVSVCPEQMESALPFLYRTDTATSVLTVLAGAAALAAGIFLLRRNPRT